MEPLTLSQGQLQEARKAAVNIIQKKHPDEALVIFTKGLRPVRSVREMECLLETEGQQLDDLIDTSHTIRLLSSAEENNSSCRRLPDTVRAASSAPF